VKILLLSTYDLGHQPFGLASPAAWLRARGHEVACADLAVADMPLAAVAEAGLIAFHLPMHTATRLALPLIERVRAMNRTARLAAYGLYAPLNEAALRLLGVDAIVGGEYEAGLVEIAEGRTAPSVSMERQKFLVPDRLGLAPLGRYSRLRRDGASIVAGYTEASRGCKHLCKHCPIVPVYNGVFRVVQADIVLADIRQQSAAGHITFGDPDFFNAPTHARRIVEAMHDEFPSLTYDVTVKVEHLLKHSELLPVLRRTGCLFVTSAVESLDDDVLLRLDKGHTRAEFVEVVKRFRDAGLTLSPTFIPFTPWTTWESYRDLLETILELDLVENVSPVQLALRLLVMNGSLLLDQVAPDWKNADPSIDALSALLLRLVAAEQRQGRTRAQIFRKIWGAAHARPLPENFDLIPRAAIPYMDEPWYC
jgi:radical SAM superfamily enzyme YgiQ (UPF0313 family)